MKKLNLVEILKNAPKGTKLWSPIFGEVTFEKVLEELDYSIRVRSMGTNQAFTSEGQYFDDYHDAECTLFPSKENRDWDNFVIEDTFEDQEKVWVKYGKLGYWEARYYSHKKGKLHHCYAGQKKEGETSEWEQCVKFDKCPF